jgi:hypothetical protein
MPFALWPDTPVASLLRDRRVTLAVTAVAAAQMGAVASGVGGWPCPLRSFAGIPCPGCGLTRAAVALVRGEWGESLSRHAFAPVLVLALVAFAVAAVLPRRQREAFAAFAERLERRTHAALLLPAALLLYWLVRLLFLPGAFDR